MQDDEIVAWRDLVEQMRRPEHADALLGDELADMAEDIGARLDVEPDGRLVEQQAAAADAAARGRFPAGASVRPRGRAPCCRRDRQGRCASAPRRCAAAPRAGRCRAGRRDRAGSASRERSRSSVRGWNTTPSSRSASPGARPMSWPKMPMRPAWMPNSRVISENSVLLPAPLRPSRAVKLAGATLKSTSISARRAP